jgi:predicted MFS family arabinose efflux permease
VAGGWLAKTYGWRIAFMVVGAPGVVVALLIKLVIKEPPRGHSDPPEGRRLADASSVPARAGLAGELSELAAVTKKLFGQWPVLNMVLGVTLASFAGYGSGQFAPPYFNRAFGLDYATVGLIFGLVGGFSAGVGTLAGGFVSDWASKRNAAWYSLTPAIGLAIATPIYILAYSQTNWRTAALILLIPGIFSYTYLGPTFGVVQNVVETRRRATATAVLFLFLNFIGLGGGTVFTGWIIDRFAQGAFNHPGGLSLWQSVSSLFSDAGAGTARFATLCPGGVAAPGSPLALAARCKSTLIGATQHGIIVTLFFYAWAAFHYLLGSFGLAKQLGAAAAERKLREA